MVEAMRDKQIIRNSFLGVEELENILANELEVVGDTVVREGWVYDPVTTRRIKTSEGETLYIGKDPGFAPVRFSVRIGKRGYYEINLDETGSTRGLLQTANGIIVEENI